MDLHRSKISKTEAIKVATEQTKLRNRGAVVTISDVKEDSGGWIVKGTSANDYESPLWGEKFEIVVDGEGKVKSSNFSLRWQARAVQSEVDNSWTDYGKPSSTEAVSEKMQIEKTVQEESVSEPPNDAENRIDEFSKPISLTKVVDEKENQGKVTSMDNLEEAAKKIKSLQASKKELSLERENLKKKIEAVTSSLELEIKGLESEIRRAKLVLASLGLLSTDESPSIEMEMAQ